MSKKIVDCVLTIDGLQLDDGESVDDLIAHIGKRFETSYDIVYDVSYEEIIVD